MSDINSKKINNLDNAGWNLFYAGGMRDIELYSATVGAAKQFREEELERKNEQNQDQPGM